MRAHEHFDLVRWNALARDLASGLCSERIAEARERSDGLVAHRLLDRLLAGGADIGESHPVGRE